MIVVAIIGVLSSIAIPGYLRYTKRSKTMEAIFLIELMYKGAVAYYDRQHVTEGGGIISPQFPWANEPPIRRPPLLQIGDKKHAREVYLGSVPEPFEQLNWDIRDPLYYSSQWASLGTGLDASFRIMVNGDLDGDDVHSTFIRLGSVTDGAEIRGGPGIYVAYPLE